MNFTTRLLNYQFKTDKTRLLVLLGIIVFAIVWAIVKDCHKELFDNGYSKVIDPAISIGTVVIAYFVWMDESAKKYKNTWEKRLNVHFVYNNEVVMSCLGASLSHEGDLRAWSQQIGQQWNNNDRLNFVTFPHFIDPVDDEIGQRITYEVRYYLKELPSSFKKAYEDFDIILNEAHPSLGYFLLWEVESKGNNAQPELKKDLYSGHPSLQAQIDIHQWIDGKHKIGLKTHVEPPSTTTELQS